MYCSDERLYKEITGGRSGRDRHFEPRFYLTNGFFGDSFYQRRETRRATRRGEDHRTHVPS